MKACFGSANILLPREGTDMQKWAIVACDQYTSQPEYWEQAKAIVGDAPSTLELILPEVYLEEGTQRVASIHGKMEQYLQEGILQERVQGFVLLERETPSGNRLGLVGLLDLDTYDYTPGTTAPVRATEGTVASRIPPRMVIRQGAPVESPHVMLLLDDPAGQLIEKLYENREKFPCVYDTELMLRGGHLRGYAISGQAAQAVEEKLAEMEQASNGFFLAVGDGNHSLATAKACWEQIKATLPAEEQADHPAKYALVEVVNLHSQALVFQPIHRELFNADMKALTDAFRKALADQNMAWTEGHEITFLFGQEKVSMAVEGLGGRLPVDVLQEFLDVYLKQHPETQIDYVHGADAVEQLTAQGNNVGILLESMEKKALFPAIQAGGVLPRKTFSMGEAYEKRYYVECRKIV